MNKEDLIKFCNNILLKLDMDFEKARATSEVLVEADLMGHSTHGVRLLPNYVSDIKNGIMKVNGNYKIISEKKSNIIIDGKLLPGIWLTQEGLKIAITKAHDFGVSTVTIGNSHHNGALAAFLKVVADEGLIGIIKSSVPSNSTVAPFGGTEPLFTPNPMAIGFPTNHLPVIIDISASITTNNMIAEKIANNEKFDFDCLLTSEGVPSNDPLVVKEEGGTVLPVGGMEYGHKGYGLALGIEALSQGLSGFGRKNNPKSMNLSTFIQVIDPEFFSGLEEFKKQMSYTVNKAKNNKPIPGKNIFIPGERALKRRDQALKNGIKLNDITQNSLKDLGKKFNESFF
tara:strand:- start:125 stop:1150 length:1026 start_codon:yes stop_codon:yes gene_type:complete